MEVHNRGSYPFSKLLIKMENYKANSMVELLKRNY